MGGRGSSHSSGAGYGSSGSTRGSSDGVITGGNTREIETTYFRSGSMGGARYKNEVLEAKTDGNGNVTFTYAQGSFDEPTSRTNKTQTVHYKLQAGAVDGETFGIDWSKVQSISGQTYSLRQAARDAGLKWDGKTKRWVRQ